MKRYMYASVCMCRSIYLHTNYMYTNIQGNSMSTQSEETGSTAAVMDIDSMNSQVKTEDIIVFTTTNM